MSEPKPIHEAGDLEVIHAIELAVLAPLKEIWPEAVAKTKELMPKLAAMDKDEQEVVLGGVWKPVAEKLDSLLFVQEHLIFRINMLRSKGILEGDPREADILQPKP
jgi:hypothetical protein